MTIYPCKPCKYTTENKSNYNKHLLSFKHQKEIENMFNDDSTNLSTLNLISNTSMVLPPKMDDHILIKQSTNLDVSLLETKLKDKQNDCHKCIHCNNIFAKELNLIKHSKICTQQKDANNELKMKELDKKYTGIISDIKNSHEIIVKELEQKHAGVILELESIHTKVINDLIQKYEYKLLELNNKLLELNNKLLQDKLQLVIDHKDDIKMMAGSAGTVAVSTMSYILNNYKSSPAILTYEIEDYPAIIEPNENNFVKEMMYQFSIDSINKYLGDYLVKLYKKDDPNKQSLFNSDVSRLNYAIREKLNDKIFWSADKGGTKTCEYIIKPFLNYIKVLLNNYNISNAKKISKIKTLKTGQINAINDETKTCLNIIMNIDNGILEKDVNKYIAPHFYLSPKGRQITHDTEIHDDLSKKIEELIQ